jgi:hypothetical protein
MTGLSYYGHQADWDTLLTNQFMIKLNPYITKTSEEWMFRAGFNTYTEIRNGEVIPRIYVKGKFSFNIVKEALVPYFGVDGYRETNNYMKITEENPYIVPGLVVTPTNHRIIVYAGLRGKITDYLAWNFRGSYSSVDDQYFFVTDTANYLQNQFIVRYDDMAVLNVYGELNIAPTESLRVFLKGNFYDYQMSRELHAWYKPGFDASLQARYNIGDKILADAGAVCNRTALLSFSGGGWRSGETKCNGRFEPGGRVQVYQNALLLGKIQQYYGAALLPLEQLSLLQVQVDAWIYLCDVV